MWDVWDVHNTRIPTLRSHDSLNHHRLRFGTPNLSKKSIRNSSIVTYAIRAEAGASVIIFKDATVRIQHAFMSDFWTLFDSTNITEFRNDFCKDFRTSTYAIELFAVCSAEDSVQ